MLKKIKTFSCLVASSVLLPLIAFAQWNPGDLASSDLPDQTIYTIIANLMQWVLGIFGFVGIIGFVISGIMYLTAAVSDSQIEKAKLAMKWSIVGVIVGIGGLVVIWAIDSALRGDYYF